MKLFLVKAKTHTYDEYDSCVVIAENKEKAIGFALYELNWNRMQLPLSAEEIKMDKSSEGVVLGSYNAG